MVLQKWAYTLHIVLWLFLHLPISVYNRSMSFFFDALRNILFVFSMLSSLLPNDLLRAVPCFVRFALMAEKCRPCLAVFSTQTCSACVLGCVQVFATPWPAAGQSPLPKGLSRQQYWSGLPLSPPEGLPDSGFEPSSLALADGFFNVEPPGKPKDSVGVINLFEYLVLRGGE